MSAARLSEKALRLGHVPRLMKRGRDFEVFSVAGDARPFFWFCVCPICGARASEPGEASDGFDLMEFAPGGGGAPIPCGLHSGCARAIDGQSGAADLRVRILAAAFLALRDALACPPGMLDSALAPGSRVAS